MIVWDLREKMMYHMSSNVVVDVVDPSIVPIQCCEPSSQVTPFLCLGKFHTSLEILITAVAESENGEVDSAYLATVPRELVFMAMVVQVSHEVQPHNKYLHLNCD